MGIFFFLEKKMHLLDTDTIFALFPYWENFSRPVLLKLE